jgi:hypothetical protein
MRRARSTRFIQIVGVTCAVFAAYAGLLCFPEPFFPYIVRADNLVLHSDRPFSEAAARGVLKSATAKLARSALYSSAREHNIYICNSQWRQRIFFNKDYGAGGVAQYPITANVFLRDARIEDNRLDSPSGTPVMGTRTLDYFVAHEVTHQLTGNALGPLRFFRSPQWVLEGYADYVGKGNAFDYAETKRAFLAGNANLDWKRSGLYLRFHLLVAYLLDHRRMTIPQLLANPPDQAEVEDAVRKEK